MLALSGRLTQRIVIHRQEIGTSRLGVSDSIRSIVTLCGPITVSLHFILTVLGVGAGLRHLNSFTRKVTHFILGYRRPILSTRLLGHLHLRRVLKRILSVLRLTGHTLGRRDVRLTATIFSGSGLLSRVGTRTAAILTNCVGRRPRDMLSYLGLMDIFHGLRHSKSRVAGVTRRVIFFVSTGILGRDKGASRRCPRGSWCTAFCAGVDDAWGGILCLSTMANE